MAKYQEFPLTFEKGFIGEIEDSVLQQGQASVLTNWEPTAQGGLRPRNGWSSISTLGLSANYKIRGWANYAVPASSSSAAIVQETALPDGVEVPPEANTNTKTATLNGTTSGNILVGIVTQDGSAGSPVVTSGFTSRVSRATATFATRLYTKVSPGGTQSFTATLATAIGHVHLFELSSVTEIPTDTDNGDALASTTLNCSSVVNTGVALIAGAQDSSTAWTNPPTLDVTQWATGSSGRSLSNGASSIYTTAIVSDSVDAAIGAGEAPVVMAIWDALPSSAQPATFYILMAVATSTGYSIYRLNRDEIQTGIWELVDAETCDDTNAFVSMSVNSGELVWSASTMTNPRYVVLSTLAGNDLTDLNDKSGRATCSHKNRMFVGGDIANPSRLHWSGIGTPHTFAANDFLDIGGDDGEAIEDLVSVEGLMLVCKTNRLYLISGSGIESFFINELPGGSASTGRATVRTPYGTIVAGPAEVWVVQGGGVDPLSRPLGVDYNISGLVSTAYAQDHALICDGGTGMVYRVNLVTGSWSKELITDGENIVYHLFSLQGRFYYGVEDSTIQVGGTRRLSSARSYDEVTGATDYIASTGKTALLGPMARYSPRFVFLQMRLQDATKPNTLFVTITTNQGSRIESIFVDTEVQRERISMGPFKGSEWVQVSYTHDSSPTHSAIDVEYGVIGTILEEQ